jgi:hypothetical protein
MGKQFERSCLENTQYKKKKKERKKERKDQLS